MKQADMMILFMLIFIGFYWYKFSYYDKKIKMYEDNEKNMQTTMDELKKRIHKFENILSSLNGSLALATSLEEYKKMIEKYTNFVKVDSEIRKIIMADNRNIMAFIHTKRQQAREKGKDIISDIAYRDNCQLIPEHIIIIDLLGELLDNAIQNSDKGSTIQVRMQVDALSLNLEVENRHIWIDDFQKEKIFLRGYSTNIDLHSMRGYGLSNVEDAVKNHYGSIRIVNSYDKADCKVVIFAIKIPS